jgi:hypothetical protein
MANRRRQHTQALQHADSKPTSCFDQLHNAVQDCKAARTHALTAEVKCSTTQAGRNNKPGTANASPSSQCHSGPLTVVSMQGASVLPPQILALVVFTARMGKVNDALQPTTCE